LPSLYIIRDVSKDKPFELEMGWLCEETNNKFSLVPKDVVDAADAAAKEAVAGGGAGSGSGSASASASASAPMDM
jgi:hypothetical protein